MAYSQTWDPASLPWDKVAPFPAPLSSVLKSGPKSDFVPDHELLTLLANQYITRDVAAGEQGLKAVQSAQAFLYLYMHVASVTGLRPAQTYTIRAGLPVSAGLGSSAAFSVSVSSALLYSHGVLPVPAPSSPSSSEVLPEHAHLVNAWAFVAEKVLHGNPSGVDNTVSALGGAIAYRRAISGRQEQSLKSLKGFDEIPFLITDTKVPRDTKTLVAGVARRKLEVSVSVSGLNYVWLYPGSDTLTLMRFLARAGAGHDHPSARLDPADRRPGRIPPRFFFLRYCHPTRTALRLGAPDRAEPLAPGLARSEPPCARDGPEQDAGPAVGSRDQTDWRRRRWLRSHCRS